MDMETLELELEQELSDWRAAKQQVKRMEKVLAEAIWPTVLEMYKSKDVVGLERMLTKFASLNAGRKIAHMILELDTAKANALGHATPSIVTIKT